MQIRSRPVWPLARAAIIIGLAASTMLGSKGLASTGIGPVPVCTASTGRRCPTLVSVVSGSPMTTRIQSPFAAPLVALVTDTDGHPVPGVAVTFAAPSSAAGSRRPSAIFFSIVSDSGQQSTEVDVTDARGEATSSTLTAGVISGNMTVVASSPGAESAAFTLTTTSGPADRVAIVGGTSRSAPAGAPFIDPLLVHVSDAHDNPVVGEPITFTAPADGPSASFARGGPSETVLSDAHGDATSGVMVANGLAGAYGVTAAATGAPSVSFQLTNRAVPSAPTPGLGPVPPSRPIVPGPPAIVSGPPALVSVGAGSGQLAAVGTAFAARLTAFLTDAHGNPVAGLPVTFTAPARLASAVFARTGSATETDLTDAHGEALTSDVSAGTTAGAGPYQVVASAGPGATTASFDLRNLAGPPASLVAADGDEQAVQVRAPLTDPLVALVLDRYGNPVPGAEVTWSAPAERASAVLPGAGMATTGADGQAALSGLVANGIAGPYAVAASVAGLPVATFSVVNTAAPPFEVTAVAGSGEIALASAPFAAPLEAVVSDADGNPVPGVAVTFSAPTAGASATFATSALTETDVTDRRGLAATSALTAGAGPGTFAVTASVPGTSGASFAMTTLSTGADVVTPVSGSGQDAPVATAFGLPLAALVTDARGVPVAGVPVTFAAPDERFAATGTGTETVTTDVTGVATSSVVSAPLIAGSDTVIATAVGAPSAAFTLTAVPGHPAAITGVHGADQRALVGTRFAVPVAVSVTDQYGNPVGGVGVVFSSPSHGPSGTFAATGATFATAITDAGGVATAGPMSAGGLAGMFAVTAGIQGIGPVVVALANLAGPAWGVVVLSGSGQAAVAGTGFAAPLSVEVTDPFDNPVPGVPVTFVAPGSGPSVVFGGSQPITSTASGVAASPRVVAGSLAGSLTILASAPGAAPVAIALTDLSSRTGP